jgi:hypothetical protein
MIIEHPKLINQTRKLDFGAGFYTTTNKKQAIEFAHKVMRRTDSKAKYVSMYEFDYENAKKDLSILHFSQASSEWLDFVYQNRLGKIEVISHDIIIGPVANDDIFKTFIFYETGAYTKEQTLNALRIKKLFNQLCFATKKALYYINYIGVLDLSEGELDDEY